MNPFTSKAHACWGKLLVATGCGYSRWRIRSDVIHQRDCYFVHSPDSDHLSRRRDPQERTGRDYSYDLQQFAVVVGDRSPGEITHRDIDRFVNSQVSRGFKPDTVNRRLAAILALFTYPADEYPALVCPVMLVLPR